MQRRKFLTVAAASIAGFSGCISEDEVDDSSSGDTGGSNDESTGTSGGNDDNEGSGLVILDEEYYEESYSAGVRGTVQNKTGSELSYVAVQAEFLDAEGTRLGEGLDNTTDLDNEQKWKFDAMFLGDNPDQIENYEIEVSDSSF